MQINLKEVIPQREDVLINQGFPKNAVVHYRIHDLLSESIEIFRTSAQPVSILSEVSISEFEGIFQGEGKNEGEIPLQNIFPCANRLALFAITMGSEVSAKITNYFEKNDFALGSMLDSVASLAAENAVEVKELDFFNTNVKNQPDSTDNCVLSYSPGYCGWHISAQKKLFKYLQPEQIGISLNSSYLMSPIKSVTGVLVEGRKEIHIFKSNFPFCSICKDKTCRDRIKKLKS